MDPMKRPYEFYRPEYLLRNMRVIEEPLETSLVMQHRDSGGSCTYDAGRQLSGINSPVPIPRCASVLPPISLSQPINLASACSWHSLPHVYSPPRLSACHPPIVSSQSNTVHEEYPVTPLSSRPSNHFSNRGFQEVYHRPLWRVIGATHPSGAPLPLATLLAMQPDSPSSYFSPGSQSRSRSRSPIAVITDRAVTRGEIVTVPDNDRCWDCSSSDHKHSDCSVPPNVIFCYGCGLSSSSSKTCLRCQTQRSHNKKRRLH